jgi:hypothetical protein
MKDYPWSWAKPAPKSIYLFTIDGIPLKRTRELNITELTTKMDELKLTHGGCTIRAYKLVSCL